MTTYPWRSLLVRWSQDVLNSPDYAATLSPGVKDAGWLGYPPASPAQLAAAEARLAQALPPSYRQFLQATNGWRLVGIPTVTRLLPVEETEWMARRHRAWIEAWETGYRAASGGADPLPDAAPGAQPDPAFVPLEHLRATLAISDGEDAIFLLNPRVVSANGEWEAWLFDVEAGISRYPSFWALMQAEHEMLRDLAQAANVRIGPEATAEQAAAGLGALIAELKGKAELYRQFARRNRILPGYELGIASGLEEASQRVRSLQEERLPPPLLRRRLDDLAAEFEDAWQASIRPASLSFFEQLHLRGQAEGYRQAMGLIRSYK